MENKKHISPTVLIGLLLIGTFYIVDIFKIKTVNNDKKYIEKILKINISKGMYIEDIRSFMKKFNRDLSFWECADNVSTQSECKDEQGYVGTLPLPSGNIMLGKGDAQIYFHIDNSSHLINYDFELYYPRYH